jgi:hypothetical protein
VEAFHLQSWWFPFDIALQCSDKLLRDLAGNAFEASCCSASLLVTLATLSSGSFLRFTGPPARPLIASDKEDEEFDNDWDCIWNVV